MEIKTLKQLTTADKRSLAFTPSGPEHTMGLLRPEDAARFQQEVIAYCDVHESVPEGALATV